MATSDGSIEADERLVACYFNTFSPFENKAPVILAHAWACGIVCAFYGTRDSTENCVSHISSGTLTESIGLSEDGE